MEFPNGSGRSQSLQEMIKPEFIEIPAARPPSYRGREQNYHQVQGDEEDQWKVTEYHQNMGDMRDWKVASVGLNENREDKRLSSEFGDDLDGHDFFGVDDSTSLDPSALRFDIVGTVGQKQVFQCKYDNCTKSYTRKYNLISHQISAHSANRPHLCSICNATFSRPHDLRRHVRSIHSSSRPFQCPYCQLTFARSDALKRHLVRDAARAGKGGSSCEKVRRERSIAMAAVVAALGDKAFELSGAEEYSTSVRTPNTSARSANEVGVPAAVPAYSQVMRETPSQQRSAPAYSTEYPSHREGGFNPANGVPQSLQQSNPNRAVWASPGPQVYQQAFISSAQIRHQSFNQQQFSPAARAPPQPHPQQHPQQHHEQQPHQYVSSTHVHQKHNQTHATLIAQQPQYSRVQPQLQVEEQQAISYPNRLPTIANQNMRLASTPTVHPVHQDYGGVYGVPHQEQQSYLQPLPHKPTGGVVLPSLRSLNLLNPTRGG